MSRKGFIAAAAFAAFAAAVAGPALAAPTLAEYTIFGENGVVIGGTTVITGLVGARNNDPSSSIAVKLNGGSSVVGDVRSGGNVNLQNNATITGSLYRPAGTTLTLGAGASVGVDLFPVDPQLPPLPGPTALTCPTGGAPMSGGNGEVVALTPGSYGDLSYGSGLTLTLNGSGDYFFDSITTGSGATLIVTAANTRIFVCGAADFGSVNVQTPSGTSCDLNVEAQAVGANAFHAGQGSDWLGNVFAPLGEISYGGGSCCSMFMGQFDGQSIDLEHAIQGSSLICGGQHEEFESGKDATILHGKQNINNGANKTLRVGKQVRSLVGFDVHDVNFAKVTKATLVLTISNNGDDIKPYSPSSQWPAAGGSLYAARLNDGFETWVQGNGNNYPIPNNPHGTGQGVTWNCGTDDNIADQDADCTGIWLWGMGGKTVQGTLRGPATLTNGMADGTQVTIDVTADVQAGLGPLDMTFMSWFLDRSPKGSVAFYSHEGAIAAGHPEYAPHLQIDF